MEKRVYRLRGLGGPDGKNTKSTVCTGASTDVHNPYHRQPLDMVQHPTGEWHKMYSCDGNDYNCTSKK
eukprot:4662880-Amphidinium_carterae.1